MKVVVVGASGLAGATLLRALSDEDRVTELVGVARRRPDPSPGVSWAQVDLAAPSFGEHDDVVDLLARVLHGADCVVHLAWAVQPVHQRALRRRTNVLGTRRVVDACHAAGVDHLVAASSIAAYQAADDPRRRPESWPTRAIPTSAESVDKAAQERELDRAETLGITVARLRPGLVLGPAAATQLAGTVGRARRRGRGRRRGPGAARGRPPSTSTWPRW